MLRSNCEACPLGAGRRSSSGRLYIAILAQPDYPHHKSRKCNFFLSREEPLIVSPPYRAGASGPFKSLSVICATCDRQEFVGPVLSGRWPQRKRRQYSDGCLSAFAIPTRSHRLTKRSATMMRRRNKMVQAEVHVTVRTREDRVDGLLFATQLANLLWLGRGCNGVGSRFYVRLGMYHFSTLLLRHDIVARRGIKPHP